VLGHRRVREALASGDWNDAGSWADLAMEVMAGGFVMLRRLPDNVACKAMTRQARYCHNPVAEGDDLCTQHARLINQREDA
jgi:hypothetical protein